MQYTGIMCTDHGTPTATVTYENPLGGTSSGSVAITDPQIVAKVEELHALISTKQGYTRADAPAPAVTSAYSITEADAAAAAIAAPINAP
jgi:hypothetical protein